MNSSNRIDIIEEMFILFLQTARVVNKYYNTYLLKEAGVSISKIAALTVLSLNGGVMNPSEIADITYTERNNITTLVARMSKEGLVRTERGYEDKRLVNIFLTEKGQEVIENTRPLIHHVIKQLAIALSEDNAILMEKPLRILRQNARDGLERLSESAKVT